MDKLRAWWLFRKAQSYQTHGAGRRAAAIYRQALDADPGDRGAWLWRGAVLAECGRYDEAREHVERARVLDSKAAVSRLFLARVLYDAGRVEEARDLVADSAENQQARCLLALCRLRAGEIEGARQILARDLPPNAWLLARLLVAIEERAGAQRHDCSPPAEEPPADRPGGRMSQLRRGLVYLRTEKWEKALAAFGAAPPDDPRTAYGLGVSLYYLDRFEQSRRLLRGAVERLDEPLASEALATLGKATLELGEAKEALLLLRLALSRGAATPENYYYLGLACLRLGRIAPARRAFERCAFPEFILQRLAEIT